MPPPKSTAALGGGFQRLGLRLLVAVILIAIWYVTRNQARDEERPPQPDPPAVARNNEVEQPQQPLAPTTSGKTFVDGTLARNVILKDIDGRTIFRGDVELKPTLERIADRERLERFNNDGVVFNNRERRLPVKPSGYYREWVHPTPESRGPGPQRIVSGADGDLWYTPDHYARFFRIRQP